ncbi:MAG: D-alanyl-D-alanine carboxypeptidase family protein [Patescibacteria group bacterium]|nr:D-alanyl-D-alanine carboxypeptidase family protein [Patescibacteria group bacterium]
MSNEKAPQPYSDDGQTVVGEGRGAPEAEIAPAKTQKEPEDEGKRRVYEQLEREFVTYADVKNMEVRESGERFVTLPQTLTEAYGAVGRYGKLTNMQDAFPLVPVRMEVKERLDRADRMLKQINSELQLVVAYGYRSMEIQEKYFTEQKQKYIEENGPTDEEMLNEIIHRMVAVPEAAGHPTGGAVDVYIANRETGQPLNFGTEIFTFGKDTYARSPFISEEAQKNRAVLRAVLMQEGFAPYDGEWWHFSFGDKEWAAYYREPCARYEQKRENEVATSLAGSEDA